VVQRAYSEQQTKPTNVTSRYDGTVLTAAAHPGHVEVVRILADAGAPLDHVVWDGSSWGKVRCMCRFSEAVEPATGWPRDGGTSSYPSEQTNRRSGSAPVKMG